MIEIDGAPGCGRVALQAVTIKAVGNVIGVADHCKIAAVAGIAVRRHAGVAVGVAACTIDGKVCAGQRKLGRRVIESRWFPRRRGMTRSAIVIEVVCAVIGIVGRGKLFIVAREALRGCFTVARRMTVEALNSGVTAAKRKLGEIVIESCRRPGHHVVATGAIVIKVSGVVIGIGS